ncbi:MAG: NAD-dependent epimerase/dehydratase family protein [Chloroflexota bacterium]
MARKVLVTGGCGYIGSVLVPLLVSHGYDVRVFDKLYFGADSLADVAGRVEIVPGDVRWFPEEAMEGVNDVVHLGSLSNDPTAEFRPEATFDINLNGTVGLAKVAKRHGVERFLFASSCSVYGFHVGDLIEEGAPTDPQSSYAASKVEAEKELLGMADASFSPVLLRQATVFGMSSRMRWDTVLNAFVMHAFRQGWLDVWYGGTAWRPLVHVRDVAMAHFRCLEADTTRIAGEVFHVVLDNYRILDLARTVQEALGDLGIDVGLRVNHDEVDRRSYLTSGEKLKRALGFAPQVTVREGVADMARAVADGKCRDFDHPMYYNMPWLKLLLDVEDRIARTGPVM